jgi:hypothetical protein
VREFTVRATRLSRTGISATLAESSFFRPPGYAAIFAAPAIATVLIFVL